MKKKRGLKINIKLSNRWLYFFITLGILIIAGVGVYAYGTSSPTTFGHSAGEITFSDGSIPFSAVSDVQHELTQSCNSGNAIRAISSTGTVTCQSTGRSSGAAIYRKPYTCMEYIWYGGNPDNGGYVNPAYSYYTFDPKCQTTVCDWTATQVCNYNVCTTQYTYFYWNCPGTSGAACSTSTSYRTSKTCDNTLVGTLLMS